MIRLKQPADEPALILLWQRTFGDDPAYIHYFFQQMGSSDCIVYEQNGQIVSMFFLLNCRFGHLKGGYIFAACTLPEWQNKGIMSKMLENAAQIYQTKKDFLCLVPANTHLFSYYQKNGFQPYFYHTIIQILNRPRVQKRTPISFEEFSSLRSSFASAVEWEPMELSFLFQENLLNGGQNLKTPTGYVLLREDRQANHCEVIEWLSCDYSEEELFSLTECANITARKPAYDKKISNGMIRFLTTAAQQDLPHKDLPFLSLVLD